MIHILLFFLHLVNIYLISLAILLMNYSFILDSSLNKAGHGRFTNSKTLGAEVLD